MFCKGMRQLSILFIFLRSFFSFRANNVAEVSNQNLFYLINAKFYTYLYLIFKVLQIYYYNYKKN